MLDNRWALLSSGESAKADALAVKGGVKSFALMEEAGRLSAMSILRHYSLARTIHILCGAWPIMAETDMLSRAISWKRGGRSAFFILARRPKGTPPKRRKKTLRLFKALKMPMRRWTPTFLWMRFLERDCRARFQAPPQNAPAAPRKRRTPLVALDMPSGVECDSGAIVGEAFRASRTLTFFRAKRGQHLMPGRGFCGEVEVLDIGIHNDVLEKIKPQSFLNASSLWRKDFPLPQQDAHKHRRGHAFILSGDPLHTGASRLAALAALRVGAGLVSLFGKKTALAIHASHLTSVMLQPCPAPKALRALLQKDPRINSLLLGPAASVGRRTRNFALAALSSDASIVLDADALTSFAAKPQKLFDAIARKKPASVVLTPHEGEFKKLFPKISGSKWARAQEAARISGAVLLLKGPDSIIAHPKGQTIINGTGSPYLATAGTGDVLAGIIAGLLAQGMGAFEAAAAAAWLHGKSAPSAGIISEDLPQRLTPLLEALHNNLPSERA